MNLGHDPLGLSGTEQVSRYKSHSMAAALQAYARGVVLPGVYIANHRVKPVVGPALAENGKELTPELRAEMGQKQLEARQKYPHPAKQSPEQTAMLQAELTAIYDHYLGGAEQLGESAQLALPGLRITKEVHAPVMPAEMDAYRDFIFSGEAKLPQDTMNKPANIPKDH